MITRPDDRIMDHPDRSDKLMVDHEPNSEQDRIRRQGQDLRARSPDFDARFPYFGTVMLPTAIFTREVCQKKLTARLIFTEATEPEAGWTEG